MAKNYQSPKKRTAGRDIPDIDISVDIKIPSELVLALLGKSTNQTKNLASSLLWDEANDDETNIKVIDSLLRRSITDILTKGSGDKSPGNPTDIAAGFDEDQNSRLNERPTTVSQGDNNSGNPT